MLLWWFIKHFTRNVRRMYFKQPRLVALATTAHIILPVVVR